MFSKKRHVRIDWEDEIEDDNDAQVSVIVTFPDSSRWAANFYTVTCIESIRNNFLSRGNREFVWSSDHLIIVDKISRTHIEKIIDESMEENTFEYLFEFFGMVKAGQFKQYPANFFDSSSKPAIDSDILLRQAAKLYEMLEHASDDMKENVKQFLFGDRSVRIEHLKLVPKLQAKLICAVEAEVKGNDLKLEWERVFAVEMDAQEKEEIYLQQYLWHIFSYGKKPCLIEKKAEEAFHNEEKSACYVFYQQHDVALYIEDAAHLNPEDLEGEQDIYIVDKDFNWTYVVTHESHCGPYFVKAPYTR